MRHCGVTRHDGGDGFHLAIRLCLARLIVEKSRPETRGFDRIKISRRFEFQTFIERESHGISSLCFYPADMVLFLQQEVDLVRGKVTRAKGRLLRLAFHDKA
jgi:hypothetical protein